MNQHLNAKISASQLIVALVVSRLSNLLFYPSISGVVSARDYLISSILSILIFLPIAACINKATDALQHKQSWFLKATFAVYVTFCAALSVIRLYMYLISVVENPISIVVFSLLLIVTIGYAVYCGIEAVVRIALLVFVLFAAAILINIGLGMSMINIKNIYTTNPVWSSGVNFITMLNTFAHPELFVLILLMKNVRNPKGVARMSVFYSISSLSILSICYFFLELYFKNSVNYRVYPITLLLGQTICTILFIAIIVVQVSLFVISSIVGLKQGIKANTAFVSLLLVIFCSIALAACRFTSMMLSICLIFGSVLTIFLITSLCFRKNNENKINSIDINID